MFLLGRPLPTYRLSDRFGEKKENQIGLGTRKSGSDQSKFTKE